MGFKEAIRTCLKEKYATFSGRATRSEFWWFQLFLYLVSFGMSFMVGLFSVGRERGQDIPPSVLAMAIISTLITLAMFLPAISGAVRRFHDRNISGWWFLGLFVALFVPIVNLLAVIAALVIFIPAGTKGPNKFGPDPLNPPSTAEVFA